MTRAFHLLWIGIVTGTVFGLLLKGIQAMSGKTVYTLLLNVDYIPWFRDQVFNEVVAFSFHLIVSVIVVFVLYFLFKKMDMASRLMPYTIASGLIATMLYTTTSFSNRTPDVFDSAAFGWWIVGHVLYGLFVGICIQKTIEKEVI